MHNMLVFQILNKMIPFSFRLILLCLHSILRVTFSWPHLMPSLPIMVSRQRRLRSNLALQPCCLLYLLPRPLSCSIVVLLTSAAQTVELLSELSPPSAFWLSCVSVTWYIPLPMSTITAPQPILRWLLSTRRSMLPMFSHCDACVFLLCSSHYFSVRNSALYVHTNMAAALTYDVCIYIHT
jgi:hypothetical protein